ncbi:MAG: hypothetical protein IPK08_10115 [Bacteroidetes bacterium]|nr:hypothetical protein [Bacteroidota bacterium]
MHRIIDIAYNKFPPKPSTKLLDESTADYLNQLNINLVKLAATFNIEEFQDNTIPQSYLDYPALLYLIPNTDLFKFIGGHPGSNKDSRRGIHVFWDNV